MTEEKKGTEEEYTLKKAVLYSFAGFTDVIFLQFFTFLIFTFYFSIIDLPAGWIALGFIIWAIWNAINDRCWERFLIDQTSEWVAENHSSSWGSYL